MSKIYDAVYFDWDGTAVQSRNDDATPIACLMEELLELGAKLIIISGTTYDRIADGRLHTMIRPSALKNMYLGLGRGAYQYGFHEGQPVLLKDLTPDKSQMMKLHKFCFDIHALLYEQYDYNTDVIFCRTNYCKIDLLPGHDRNGMMFLQDEEVGTVQRALEEKGVTDGLTGLIRLAASNPDLPDVKGTSDAKHLEVGFTTKGDNVDFFVDYLYNTYGVEIESCVFWGDEFADLAEGVPGSDAMMITASSRSADFFDVSDCKRPLPKGVVSLGGGVESFRRFVLDQIHKRSSMARGIDHDTETDRTSGGR